MSSVARALRSLRDTNRSRHQLRSLDDHTLRDIGIRRDAIDSYVEGARYDSYLAGCY